MAKGKLLKIGKKFGVSVWLSSDGWYEEIEDARSYQYASIGHRVHDGVLILSLIILWVRISVLIG